MKTRNYESILVDVFDMAFVGGGGTFEEVATHLVRAVEDYNDAHGTNLILKVAR